MRAHSRHGQPHHVVRRAAGEWPDDPEWLAETGCALAILSAASAPLTVELFAGGVLSALLRMAQRWVAAQPRGRHAGAVAVLEEEGLVCVVEAFGFTVPQARAHSPAEGGSPKPCPQEIRSPRCLSACRWLTSIR